MTRGTNSLQIGYWHAKVGVAVAAISLGAFFFIHLARKQTAKIAADGDPTPMPTRSQWEVSISIHLKYFWQDKDTT